MDDCNKKSFQKFREFLSEKIFIPDTMQEFCRKHRFNFSKAYLNKFFLFSGKMYMGIYTSYISKELICYFENLGLITSQNIFCKITNKNKNQDLHDIILQNPKILKIMKVIGKGIFTYKIGEKTQNIEREIGTKHINRYQYIKFLSNKSNLYKIFPKKYLPERYTISNLPKGNIIIKPVFGANSRGIMLASSYYITLEKHILKNNGYIFQEYIEGDICHSITFINIHGEIQILYTAQQKINEIKINNYSSGFNIPYSYISSEQNYLYKEIYQQILELVINSKDLFQELPVFVIEFIIQKDKQIKIMEINPRIGSSIVMANVLFEYGKLFKNSYYLSNRTLSTRYALELFYKLKEHNLLFNRKNVSSILPINISNKFHIFDFIIIGKDKEEHDYILNMINNFNENC